MLFGGVWVTSGPTHCTWPQFTPLTWGYRRGGTSPTPPRPSASLHETRGISASSCPAPTCLEVAPPPALAPGHWEPHYLPTPGPGVGSCVARVCTPWRAGHPCVCLPAALETCIHAHGGGRDSHKEIEVHPQPGGLTLWHGLSA